MKRIHIFENGINLSFEIENSSKIKLIHFSALPFDPKSENSASEYSFFKFSEEHNLKFKDFRDTGNQLGRKLEIVTSDEQSGLKVVSHIQFYKGFSITRVWKAITNNGSSDVTLNNIASFPFSETEKLLNNQESSVAYLESNGSVIFMQGDADTDCIELQPGDNFETAPYTVGVCIGGYDSVVKKLTEFQSTFFMKKRPN